MNNKKINIVSLFCLFIVFQPIFDVFVYWVKEIKQVDLCIISIIRPLIAILFYFVLLFSKKINKSLKIYSFIYLSITGIYFILHLLNVKDNFFELSYGNIQNEARQLINYGYYILQLINVFLIFKISDKNEKKRIIMSIVCACGIMSILYLTSVITKTSLLTYGNHSIKQGFKGWSISSHYIGHSLLLMFPIVIFSIYNNYLKNNLDRQAFIIFKPMPSPIDKIQNRFRWRIIIKGNITEEVNTLINKCLQSVYEANYKDTRVTVDVNPNNMI